jgi:signal transduction histidine kinase
MDIFFDQNGLTMLTRNPIRYTFAPLMERGVAIRFIAEITEDNLDSCKELMKFGELRHLEGAKGNFAIGDSREIRVPDVVKKGVPASQMLRSTARSYVDQQQHVFEILWSKAISARARIAQIEQGIEPEITQVITGWDNIFKNAIETFQDANDRVDSCCDALVPAIIVNSPMHQASADFVRRGGTIRLITEITKENIPSVKELMKTQEVRHMNGCKLNFGVTASSYTAPTSVYSMSSEPQTIESNSRDLISQHQFLFDELWQKAIPAKVRISQLEEGIEPEVTEVITGWAAVIQKTIEGFSRARQSVDHCCDSLVPPRMVGSDVSRAMSDFTDRGGRIRLITEITEANLASVKELMKTQHIRHINGFKLNFGVSEVLFAAPTSVYSVSSEPQCIWSNSKALISQHQYLFEGLWNISIPADVRIREIEQGIVPDVIETISDPDRIQKVARKLVENAKEELLIIFSSTNASLLQEGAGLIGLIEEKARDMKVVIRIITPIDEKNRELVSRWTPRRPGQDSSQISLRTTEASAQSMLSIVVADRAFSLAVEFKESASLPQGSVGFATYSNSKPTVLSYVTVFQSMWSQAELNAEIKRLYDQLKIQDQQQKEFMDIAAHEFKNPLQPILVLTDILQRHSTDSRSQELLNVITRNAKRLQTLQEEILDVAKIERHLLVLDRQAVDLSELVDEIVKEFQTQPNEKIEINFVCSSKLDVLADGARISQVIFNLLNNASKFTKRTIRVRCKKTADGRAMVEVEDDGKGIDGEILPRLFTKFTSKSAGGTGLGLYISKAIIEAHGGSIWAENMAPAGGAKFTFTLPLFLAN